MKTARATRLVAARSCLHSCNDDNSDAGCDERQSDDRLQDDSGQQTGRNALPLDALESPPEEGRHAEAQNAASHTADQTEQHTQILNYDAER